MTSHTRRSREHAPRLATLAALTLLGCGALLAAGCTTTTSRGIDDHGKAREIVFPDPQKTAWQAEGSFPEAEALDRVDVGVSKDQLYTLLGRPHFREGLAGVREWDYLFHFRVGPTRRIITCQYKVIFDKDYRAGSMHWKPAGCADVARDQLAGRGAAGLPASVAMPAPAAAPIVAVPAPAPVPHRLQLSADALFPFDRSGRDDLTVHGVREIVRYVEHLRLHGEIARITVEGHTDRLGVVDYNRQLSQARAGTIRDLLVSLGVPAERIEARGHGAASPVSHCGELPRQRLIDCLAPDRRVEIQAELIPPSGG